MFYLEHIMFNFFRRPMNFKTGTSNDMKDVKGPYVELE